MPRLPRRISASGHCSTRMTSRARSPASSRRTFRSRARRTWISEWRARRSAGRNRGTHHRGRRMAGTLRDRLLAKGVIKSEKLTIDDITVEVRGLTAGQRGRLLNTGTREEVDEDGEKQKTIDLEKLGPMLVIACVYDPETGQPLFSEADRDALGLMSAEFQDRLVEVASRLSGLGPNAAKGAEKNSAPILSGTPSSTSPESSAV